MPWRIWTWINTNHCIEKNQSPVEQDTETNQLPIEEDTESNQFPKDEDTKNNQFPIGEDTENNQISVDKDPEKNHPPIEEEKEIHKNDENCPIRYINKCYSHCPEDTCITQDDLELKNCIPITLETKVFNDLCFN